MLRQMAVARSKGPANNKGAVTGAAGGASGTADNKGKGRDHSD